MLPYRSLHEIREAINRQELDLPSLVESYLQRIDERINLNAFVEVFGKEALDSARLIQDKMINGTAGKLAGMVIGLKDNICYKGHRINTRIIKHVYIILLYIA